MTLRSYIYTMSAATLVAWGAFLFIIVNVDPTRTPVWGFLFFYATLFLSFLGTFSLILLWVRLRQKDEENPVFKRVAISYRQGIWVSLLILVSLALKSFDLWTWWNMLLLVFSFTLLEFFFLSLSKKVIYTR
ncbi:MAG: Uncharacterized protein G01um101418_509 [Parcubacteria group bacterium Gr01-1014_18]|nr:MAG: Uncharacterized protein Greene041636_555 [Parcubacteria group bacterium Greene0416_36]TSC80972.1 MAG: Uncharacterized protein G01um101418_509 [Parcubacteria group bacterium Gr01-1014_18]TSC98859.1 MAG: Uncharacterized protein Greene101420_492 [Parcubacteria group bacterium Greene1014_20]TSD06555.1 MAG: Uncharacterized protein Greene07142_830 [Parcubacteria group bacterium Greene0714_2]